MSRGKFRFAGHSPSKYVGHGKVGKSPISEERSGNNSVLAQIFGWGLPSNHEEPFVDSFPCGGIWPLFRTHRDGWRLERVREPRLAIRAGEDREIATHWLRQSPIQRDRRRVSSRLEFAPLRSGSDGAGQ